MAYFRLEHSRRENRITLSDIHFFRNVSTGTIQKVEFYLLANRISKKLFVDDKQPDALLCVKCHPSLHPPTRGSGGGGGGGQEEKFPRVKGWRRMTFQTKTLP